MASYGIQVQMYIDDKPTGKVFNHSTTRGNIKYSLDGTNFQVLGYAIFSD